MDFPSHQPLSQARQGLGALHARPSKGGIAARLQDGIPHLKHIWGCVFEEHVVAGAEGREAGVATVGLAETMLRAFSVTDVGIFTGEASGRKGIALVQSEAPLHIG